jgi:hypothetical protein
VEILKRLKPIGSLGCLRKVTGLPSEGQQLGQDPAYDTDQNGPKQRTPKAVDLETLDECRNQPEHQAVDDKKEKPKGQQREGESKKDQNGANEHIDDTQEKGCHQGCHHAIHPDQSRQKIGDDEDGHHVD